MEYRVNQRTSDKISVLGFGTSYIAEARLFYGMLIECKEDWSG